MTITASHSACRALAEFLLNAFSAEELRIWLSQIFDDSIVHGLRDGISPASFFHECVALMNRHGLLTDWFFEKLAEVRAGRKTEIEEIAAQFGAKGPPGSGTLELTFRGNLADLDAEKVRTLISAIRQFMGDRGAYLFKISSGSVIVVFVVQDERVLHRAISRRNWEGELREHLAQRVGLDLLAAKMTLLEAAVSQQQKATTEVSKAGRVQVTRRKVAGGGLRQSIVETSLGIGEERGERGLTMRGIAAGLGVSVTALYQHFESKSALLKEIIVYGAELFQQDVVVPASNAGNPIACINAASLGYFDFASEHKWLYSVVMGEAPSEWGELSEDRREIVLSPLRAFRQWFVEGVRLGLLRKDIDVDAASLGLWSSLHGLCMMHINRGLPGVDVRAVIAWSVQSFCPSP